MERSNEQEWDAVFLVKKTTKAIKGQAKSQLSATEAKYRTLEDSEVPSDTLSKKISENLRRVFQAARIQKKLSQKQLAQQANLDVKIVNEIESGKREFNDVEIRKCEKVFGKLQRK